MKSDEIFVGVFILAVGCGGTSHHDLAIQTRGLLGIDHAGDPFDNPSGRHQTISIAGSIDPSNEFFQSLGTNGRACGHCHPPTDGFGLSARSVRDRFLATCDFNRIEPTCGEDPLFRLVDGATSPNADVSTNGARLDAYALLLRRGLIRVEREVPKDAEFEIIDIDDPYNHATPTKPNFYRRPLLSTNLKFLGAFEKPNTNNPQIMWDGRESETRCVTGLPPAGDPCSELKPCPDLPGVVCVSGNCRLGATQCANPSIPRNPFDDFKSQANNATIGHAEGAPLSDAQLTSIVNFERDLFTAQVRDNIADLLSVDGANGGPVFLSTVPYLRNRQPPIGPGQREDVFHIYDAWKMSSGDRRASIARGQALFNFREGILPKLGSRTLGGRTIRCGTCHNGFEAGTESAGTWGNGVTDSIGSFLVSAARRSPGVPLYAVRNIETGETIKVTDLGRGMTTGKWADIGKFKTAQLRSLSSHAPYRHDGSDATLEDVVDSYQAAGFSFNFTEDERADLVAFLESL